MPAAIRFGIPADVFWELNPKYMYIYQDAYIKEKEEQVKMLDVAAYYQGLYVQQAVASCSRKEQNIRKAVVSGAEEKSAFRGRTVPALGGGI